MTLSASVPESVALYEHPDAASEILAIIANNHRLRMIAPFEGELYRQFGYPPWRLGKPQVRTLDWNQTRATGAEYVMQSGGTEGRPSEDLSFSAIEDRRFCDSGERSTALQASERNSGW